MINQKEIVNRVYEDKVPVAFEYVVENVDGPKGEKQRLRVWFEKLSDDKSDRAYKVFTIIGMSVYEYPFTMPKQNMPIEMVVAYGLNVLKYLLQDEANYKEMLSFTIGEVTKDM